MNKTRLFAGLIALSLSSAVFAADAKKTAAPAMDPAMMEKMKHYSTPGAEHKALQPFVGKWNCTVTSWMKPGAAAEVSKAKGSVSWIMGGRFLEQRFAGMWAGKPFEGLGYVGYDNMRKEYQSVWIDSMATGLMWSTGKLKTEKNTLILSGSFSCPMTGDKKKHMRSEWTIKDKDTNTFATYMNDENGKEFKNMEIVYKRIK